MFSLLLEVTTIFLLLFIIVPIVFMSIFMRYITHEKNEKNEKNDWGKESDADIVNH